MPWHNRPTEIIPTETYQTEAFTDTIWQEKEAPEIVTQDDIPQQEMALAKPLVTSGLLNGRYQLLEQIEKNHYLAQDTLYNRDCFLIPLEESADMVSTAQKIMGLDDTDLPKAIDYFYSGQNRTGYLVVNRKDVFLNQQFFITPTMQKWERGWIQGLNHISRYIDQLELKKNHTKVEQERLRLERESFLRMEARKLISHAKIAPHEKDLWQKLRLEEADARYKQNTDPSHSVGWVIGFFFLMPIIMCIFSMIGQLFVG